MRIPDALQVQGLGAGPGAGDHQVPPVMEEQAFELRIGRTALVGCQPLIGWEVRRLFRPRCLRADMQIAAVKQRAVILHVALANRFVCLRGIPQNPRAFLNRLNPRPVPASRRIPRNPWLP